RAAASPCSPPALLAPPVVGGRLPGSGHFVHGLRPASFSLTGAAADLDADRSAATPAREALFGGLDSLPGAVSLLRVPARPGWPIRNAHPRRHLPRTVDQLRASAERDVAAVLLPRRPGELVRHRRHHVLFPAFRLSSRSWLPVLDRRSTDLLAFLTRLDRDVLRGLCVLSTASGRSTVEGGSWRGEDHRRRDLRTGSLLRRRRVHALVAAAADAQGRTGAGYDLQIFFMMARASLSGSWWVEIRGLTTSTSTAWMLRWFTVAGS